MSPMHLTLNAGVPFFEDVWRINSRLTGAPAFDQSKRFSEIQHVHVCNVSLARFAAKVADKKVLPIATY